MSENTIGPGAVETAAGVPPSDEETEPATGSSTPEQDPPRQDPEAEEQAQER